MGRKGMEVLTERVREHRMGRKGMQVLTERVREHRMGRKGMEALLREGEGASDGKDRIAGERARRRAASHAFAPDLCVSLTLGHGQKHGWPLTLVFTEKGSAQAEGPAAGRTYP